MIVFGSVVAEGMKLSISSSTNSKTDYSSRAHPSGLGCMEDEPASNSRDNTLPNIQPQFQPWDSPSAGNRWYVNRLTLYSRMANDSGTSYVWHRGSWSRNFMHG